MPQPPTLPGTNLTPGELLRLILLLCIPPWLLAAGIFLTRLGVQAGSAFC